MNSFDFAIIGGDQRQQYLYHLLLKHGYSVICYGITPLDCAAMASSLNEALQQSKIIIAPIPFSRDGIQLTQLPGETPVFIHKLMELLDSTHTIIAGNLPSNFSLRCHCIDLLKQESFLRSNSLITAEVAVAIAILNHPDDLCNNYCLITGYGHCAKAIASYLSQQNAAFCIAARSPMALQEVKKNEGSAISLYELNFHLRSFSIIFNTIPCPIFSEDSIMECSPSTLYLELASSPGGLTNPIQAQKHCSVLSCAGLPGRYSPLASAKAIFQEIIDQVSQKT